MNEIICYEKKEASKGVKVEKKKKKMKFFSV